MPQAHHSAVKALSWLSDSTLVTLGLDRRLRHWKFHDGMPRIYFEEGEEGKQQQEREGKQEGKQQEEKEQQEREESTRDVEMEDADGGSVGKIVKVAGDAEVPTFLLAGEQLAQCLEPSDLCFVPSTDPNNTVFLAVAGRGLSVAGFASSGANDPE
mmetsp:Transcript_70140/g.146739  ORF Transcript_70140/g.146739 Transcript_70140/m.146739 type:complete len:156 (-) Transcript_70140:57-524(-)